jgi:hypothetical protein
MKIITSIIFSSTFAIVTSVSIPHVQAQGLNQSQANAAQEKLNSSTQPKGYICIKWINPNCG